MEGERIWISTLLLVPLISFAVAQNVVVVAPITFRLGVDETVGVFVTKGLQQFDLYLQDYPGKNNTFSRLTVSLDENDSRVVPMRVNPEHIPDFAVLSHSTKHYVVIVAEGRNFRTETKVLVTLHSGYIFVQSDKYIYEPNQIAHFRIIQLKEDMHIDKGNFTLEIRNPQYIIVEQKSSTQLNEKNGLYSLSFSLPQKVMEGAWSLQVKNGHKMRQAETIGFKVKKYSLPKYKVAIKGPVVILPTTDKVEVEVEAKYLYGKHVDGTVKCRFYAWSRTIYSFDFTIVNVGMLREGKAICNISRKQFEDTGKVNWLSDFVNWRLDVNVTVTERETGHREYASSINIFFSQTKYLVDFKMSLKDFRPGYFVTVLAVITEASRKVAPNVDAHIEVKDQNGILINCHSHVKSNEEGIVSFLIPTTTDVKQLLITVATEDKELSKDLQGESHYEMVSLTSSSYVFLDRSIIPHTLEVGRKFTGTVYANPEDIAISYVVTTGGRVVHLGSLAANNVKQRILQFRISDLMVPSVRITLIAVRNETTLSDSIKIYVEKKCRDQTKISVESSFKNTKPGEQGKITIHGTSGTVVGILAADKAIPTHRNQGLLTKEHMYSKMEEHDLGCGPGSGLSPEQVLANAGLLILSDTSTFALEPHGCTERRFHKRDVLEDVHSLYDTCGEDEDYSQERKFHPEIWLFETYVIGEENRTDLLLTSPPGITTWMIQAVGVNPNHGMCVADPVEAVIFKNLFIQLEFPYSVVRNEQIEIRATVFNYGATRRAVTVYMYGVEGVCSEAQPSSKGDEKRIYVPGNGGTETVTFPVVPLKIGTFPIKVVAMSTDENDAVVKDLNVMAEGIPHVEDIVLVIDPSSILQRSKLSYVSPRIRTRTDSENRQQVSYVSLTPNEDFILGTDSCTINAIGERYGPVSQTVLNNPEKLIEIPTGNGEQTMIGLSHTLYALHYLNATGKLTQEQETNAYNYVRDGYSRALTFRKPDGSYGASLEGPSSMWLTAFVAKVFCQARKYVHVDENFICTALNWWAKRQYYQGPFYETVNAPVSQHKMNGGVKTATAMIAFITINLYKCQCGKEISENAKEKAVMFLTSIQPAITCSHLLSIVTYALSLADPIKAGSEANTRLLEMSNVNHKLNTRHWEPAEEALSVETASYALLTQLVYKNLNIAEFIVNWLNTQRTAQGDFSSTQETVIALEALAEYTIHLRNYKTSLACNLMSSVDLNFNESFEINTTNLRDPRNYELNKLRGHLILHAVGTGIGILVVQLRYNVPKKLDEICKFEINVNVTETKEIINLQKPMENSGPRISMTLPVNRGIVDELRSKNYTALENSGPRISKTLPVNRGIVKELRSKHYAAAEPNVSNSVYVANISICVKHFSNKNAGKTIVDTGIFTGFTPIKTDLDMIVNDSTVPVKSYEETGRRIVFYFDYIPHAKSACFWFRATREYIVGNLVSSTIKVFEYLKPEHACTKFYSLDPDNALIQTVCTYKVCKCAKGECAREEPFKEILNLTDVDCQQQQLLEIICGESDYAWRVLVEKIEQDSSSFLIVNVKVLSVLKEGRENRKSLSVEPERQFLLLKTCRTGHLEIGKTYIIMGPDQEPTMKEDGELKYTYYITRQTRIHEWFDTYKRGLEKTSQEINLQRSFQILERVLIEEGCLY